MLKAAPDAQGRVHDMPNAIGFSDRDVPFSARRPNSGPLLAVTASRFDVEKRPITDLLLTFWDRQLREQLGNIHWVVAGDGIDLPELRAAARMVNAALGHEAVLLPGWLSSQELDALWEKADFSISPGRSALESIAAGLPTIAVGSVGVAGLCTPDTYQDMKYTNFGGTGTTQAPSQGLFVGLPQT